MRLPRRQFLSLAAAAAACHAAARIAWGQNYPERPVRVIVPYAPGGPTDVITRLVAQKLTERVGKQFFVENMGGGGGNIGMGRAAKAEPDGYTMLVVNPSYVVNPTLYDKVPYEFEQGFRSGNADGADDLGAGGPPVGAGAHGRGARRAHQGQSRQVQLRFAGDRDAGPSHRRGVPPVAGSRPRACAVQRRGSRRRLVGCRTYADLLRLALAGGAAGASKASCAALP